MTGGSSKALPETAENRSSRFAAFRRLEPVWTVVLIAAIVGAILLVVAEFSTLRSVKVLTASCSDLADPSARDSCVVKGHEEHMYAFAVMGVFALLMAWGAAVGRSRPATLALIAIGAAVLAISFATDVPDIHKTGVLGERFDSAKAVAGPALFEELVGGALLLAAGVMGFVAARTGTTRRRRRRRR